MSERNVSFELQNRFEWYQVNRFLKDLGSATQELNIPPTSIVHLGGTANYYRYRKVFGSSTVFHYRGTKDMDILCFRPGAVQQVFERMSTMPNPTIDSCVIERSYGLPDKKSAHIQFISTSASPESNKFEVDIYESGTNKVKFNDRVVSEEKILLDPPEVLVDPIYKTASAVPSLRDAFVIKMDIVDYSKTGLRPKDQVDILGYIKILEKMGLSFGFLLRGLVETSGQESALKKLDELEMLFTRTRLIGGLPIDYPFFPTRDQLTEAVKDIKRFRDNELYK